MFDDGGQVQHRPLQRSDTWGPMDDSKGQGVQSYIDPLANPDDGSISLQECRIGSIPTQQQCEESLIRERQKMKQEMVIQTSELEDYI